MKVLILAGSSRKESLNQKLQKRLAEVAEGLNMTVNLYPAAALDAPIYNGDDEEASGYPESTKNLNSAISNADKVVIVSPEYNGSVPPLLKNAIDWSTRENIGVWKSKVVLLASASPGALGGMRSLSHLRDILSNLKAWIAPEFGSIKNASAQVIAETEHEFFQHFLQQGD